MIALAWQYLVGLTSDLILMKPVVFVKNVAKFRYLESEKPGGGSESYLEEICGYLDFRTYPDPRAKETVLRRRIAALGALDIPEHKGLIERCIRLIEKSLGSLRH